MKLIRCDRCKNEMETDQSFKISPKSYLIVGSKVGSQPGPDGHFDLCEPCYVELVKFVNGGGSYETTKAVTR